MSDVLEQWFNSFDKPRWRYELDINISEIKRRSGLSKEQINKLADVLEEMKIIRI